MKYNYDEVYSNSLEYFSGDELAAKVFVDKYALQDNDGAYIELTPKDMHKRISKEFARIEQIKYSGTEMLPLTEDEIFSYLDEFKYIIPQGSPMYGIGNIYQTISLSNCFVLNSPVDSYGGILKTDEQLVQMCKRRGGVGLDLSNIRPETAYVNNAAKSSTGIIPFMERYSNSIREVGQGGRRGALMISISVHHPQILDFTTIKNDLTKVTGANISVRLSNDFLEAVTNDTEYELCFPVDYKERNIEPIISKTISAKHVWNTIIKNAHSMAEPGILFWDNIINESIPDCYKDYGFKTTSTNPCGEIPLSELDSCRLLVVNLYNLVKNPYTKNAEIDWQKFDKVVQVAQRLMDDIVDLETEKVQQIIDKIKSDPEKDDVKYTELTMWQQILDNTVNGRRTGLGTTAWGDMFAELGVGYGTDESVVLAEEISKRFKHNAYLSSVLMAKATKPFPIWNKELEQTNPFLLRIKDENPELYELMLKYGRKNIALLTAAPTGSVSICAQTTSGIEPLFMLGYKRRKKINSSTENVKVDFVDKNGDKWQEFMVYHKKINDWMRITGETDIEKSPWYGYCAEDINWKNRVRFQAALQKNICHSISSTVNLPEDISIEEVKTIYETAWKSGCKGITVYRKNSRSGVLVEDKKETETTTFIQSKAPKRPKTLDANVHHFKIEGNEYYVTVGLLENLPYEIFVGKNNIDNKDIFIPRNVSTGKITKVKRGQYILISDDNRKFLLSGQNIDTEMEDLLDAITRMVSTSLRHGASISFVVQQLEKTRGPLFTFSKALARALKKYIQDGEKVHGEECPECKSISLIRQDGCVSCANCSWTRCS